MVIREVARFSPTCFSFLPLSLETIWSGLVEGFTFVHLWAPFASETPWFYEIHAQNWSCTSGSFRVFSMSRLGQRVPCTVGKPQIVAPCVGGWGETLTGLLENHPSTWDSAERLVGTIGLERFPERSQFSFGPARCCIWKMLRMALVVKNLTASAGDIRDSSLIPGSGRSPGGWHDHPHQYSCLENPMNRGVWLSTIHGLAQNHTQLKWFNTHTRGRGRWLLNPHTGWGRGMLLHPSLVGPWPRPMPGYPAGVPSGGAKRYVSHGFLLPWLLNKLNQFRA